MMKLNRILSYLVGVAMLLGASSCRHHTIIPDDELAEIFHDVFLANAYTARDINRMDLDSLKIYEPIFAKSGYTISDIQYTIGNFSKRKSARLGDVVEVAIARLEQESAHYAREVAILDTINHVAQRTFKRTIHQDSLIRIKRLKDTVRAKMTFDLQPGDYVFELDYEIDSLDQNTEAGLRATFWVEKNDKRRTYAYDIPMQRLQSHHFKREFTADSTFKILKINFCKFAGKPRRPSLSLRNVKLEYKPAPEIAVDSLFLKQLNPRIFADEFFEAFVHKTDSLSLAVDKQ